MKGSMQASSLQAAALPLPGRLQRTFAGQTGIALAASAFVALCAHVSLPLLFTPVPLTLGNFAVVLVGLVLGPRLGFGALVLYLLEGGLGLPVFNPGGLGGVAQLLGPTGGYLFAYPFAAALAGTIARSLSGKAGRFFAGLTASLFSTLLVLSLGLLWLAHVAHLSAHAALMAGLLPFLPGEAIKIVVAAGIFQTLTRRPTATPPFQTL